MKIVVDRREKICSLVAAEISELAADEPDARVALCTGNTMREIYAELSSSEIDFSDVSFFGVTEYPDLAKDDKNRCANELCEELYSKINAKKTHTPCGDSDEAASAYDGEIAACGGLSLALLGIGLNGHIGYNEPATPYDSVTHIAKLTDSTRRMKAELFGGEDKVPERAVTMGLHTLCSAKRVILVAFGAEKADAVYKLVYGKTDTYVPAAMLQMHMNMTLYLDDAAASKLS